MQRIQLGDKLRFILKSLTPANFVNICHFIILPFILLPKMLKHPKVAPQKSSKRQKYGLVDKNRIQFGIAFTQAIQILPNHWS